MSPAKEIVILTPTPNEYRSVSRHAGLASLRRLAVTVVECGPGKINSAFAAAREVLPKISAQGPGAILIGAGTSGSLSLDLAGGEVIASNSSVICDWRMEDGESETVSPYGWFDYRAPDPAHVERMVIECRDPLIEALLGALSPLGFKTGRMLTSDCFISGKEHKLAMGRRYGCLACDMESGAFGYLANRHLGIPWINFRVVADTLDEALSDYFAIERDMTDILGQKLVEALGRLDGLL